MKRTGLLFLVIVLLSSFFISGCYFNNNEKIGNGSATEGSINLKSKFNKIEISNVEANIYISSKKSDEVNYKIDKSIEKYLSISVKDNKLIISSTNNEFIRNKKSDDTNKFINIYVGSDTLNEIYGSGAINIIGDGNFKEDDLNILLSGDSDLEMNVEAKNLDINLSGASSIKLSGVTTNLSAKASGASIFILKELKADNIKLDVSGASNAEVQVLKSGKLTASGSSSVTYYATDDINPETSVSGASSIEKVFTKK